MLNTTSAVQQLPFHIANNAHSQIPNIVPSNRRNNNKVNIPVVSFSCFLHTSNCCHTTANNDCCTYNIAQNKNTTTITSTKTAPQTSQIWCKNFSIRILFQCFDAIIRHQMIISRATKLYTVYFDHVIDKYELGF